MYNIYFQLVTQCLYLLLTDYCCDMFRPQFLAIFRELEGLSAYTAYVATYAEERNFLHPSKLIKIKILESLKSVCG